MNGCASKNDRKEALGRLKAQFNTDSKLNQDVSAWYDAAMTQGLYPLPKSADETDTKAIAEMSDTPKSQDDDGD